MIGRAVGNHPGHGPPSRSQPDSTFGGRLAPDGENRHQAGGAEDWSGRSRLQWNAGRSVFHRCRTDRYYRAQARERILLTKRMPQVVDRDRLPEDWPTHRGSSEFWEELGRAVASFSYLEDTLARAYFGLTGTKTFETVDQAEAAFPEWAKELKQALTDSLYALTSKLGKAFEDDDRVPKAVASDFIAHLDELRVWRNALCHGAWQDFSVDGSSQLRYFRKTAPGVEQLDVRLTLEKVSTIRLETVELTLDIMDLLSAAGVQFPGTAPPDIDDARCGQRQPADDRP